ncbi:hypothetical protein V8F20_006203 [Naviculisporaceae sp. PSN 640]
MAAQSNQRSYKLPSDAVWFITGCSSGIGKAVAALIASHPTNRLVATARNVSSLSYLPTNPRILALPLDVTSTSSIESAMSTTVSQFGRIDVVVNNAGYAIMADAEGTPDDLARKLMDTNFWGPVNITKRALGIMRDINPSPASNGQIGGVIINLTSMGGRVAYPGQAFYHASKFALEGYTEGVAKELRDEWNIHCCLVEPGGVQTNYATTSMVTPGSHPEAVKIHPAYVKEDTPSRVLEKFIGDEGARRLWADADRIAEVIYGVVGDFEGKGEGKRIPLRVPLGGDAWGVLKMENEKAARELDEIKELAVGAGKEGQLEALMGVSMF